MIEAYKEIGKGLISLANLAGSLSLINVVILGGANPFYIIIIIYTMISFYFCGFHLIKGK
jgi:hypothetical protein